MGRALLPAPGYERGLAAGRAQAVQRVHFGGSVQLTTVVAGMLLAACCGLAAGYSPAIGAGVALATVIVVVTLRDLAVGMAVFTAGSFGSALAGTHVASGSKALGFVLLLAWIATLARRPRGEAIALLREQRWLVVFAGSLLAWSLLSAAWAHSSGTALSGASRWAMDLVLLPIMFTAVQNARHLRWVMAAFVAGALLAMVYGAATGTTSVGGSRLAGALGDPNETAAVLVAGAVIALTLAAAQRDSRKLRWLAFAAAIASVIGLAATASRGGLVALGVALVAAVLMAGRWRRKAAITAAIGALVVAGWFLIAAPASSLSHISNLQSGRTTLWTVAGRTIQANPLLGVGQDNFATAATQYLDQPGATTDAYQVVINPHVAHSIYLEIWADLGVVGLALFAALTFTAMRATFKAVALFEKAGRLSDEILARGLFVAIVAMLGADIFLSNLYSKQMFLLLGLAPAMLAIARRGPALERG